MAYPPSSSSPRKDCLCSRQSTANVVVQKKGEGTGEGTCIPVIKDASAVPSLIGTRSVPEDAARCV